LFVHTSAESFSAQQLVQFVLKKNVTFLYWTVQGNITDRFQLQSVFPIQKSVTEQVFTKSWMFVEFLATSPEAPIENLDKQKPVYKQNLKKFERLRMRYYKDVSEGELEFAVDYQKVFGKYSLQISGEFAVQWINYFIESFTEEDKIQLKELQFAVDPACEYYMPVFQL